MNIDEGPAVTVVIPTYNRAHLLERTINAALAQTTSSTVLVVDDASTDETPQLQQKFADTPRVLWYRQSKNVGMAANWRAGIERVRTQFFCLLNDDDILEPDCIESLLAPLVEDGRLILAFCDHWVIDKDGRRLVAETEEYQQRYGRSQLARGVLSDFRRTAVIDKAMHVSCTLFRSNMVTADFIDDGAQGFACGWLFYRCARSGNAAYYVPRRLVSYRTHPGNMSREPRWRMYIVEGQLYWYRSMIRDSEMAPIHHSVRISLAHTLSSYGIWILEAGRRSDARKLFQESLALRKNAKAYVGYGLSLFGPFGIAMAAALRAGFSKVPH